MAINKVTLGLKTFIFIYVLKFILIGGQLLYNVVLVSGLQQPESGISIHISLTLEPPCPLGHHREPN